MSSGGRNDQFMRSFVFGLVELMVLQITRVRLGFKYKCYKAKARTLKKRFVPALAP